MSTNNLYENFHSKLKLQKRVISEKDFTYRNIINEIGSFIKKTVSVLDIGCGAGTLSYYLAAKGNSVKGVDLSRNAVLMARKNSKLLGLEKRMRFEVRNFPDEKISGVYDLVLLIEVIEHIRDDHKAIRQAYKLVKRGGILLISVPSKNSPLYKLGLLTKFDDRVGHLRRYNTEELSKLVRESGLSIKKISLYEGVLRNLFFTNNFLGIFLRFIKGYASDAITFLDNILVKSFDSSQIILVATKK